MNKINNRFNILYKTINDFNLNIINKQNIYYKYSDIHGIRISNDLLSFFTTLNDTNNKAEYILQLLFSNTMNIDYSNHIKNNFLLDLISLSFGDNGYINTHNDKQKIKLGKFINKIVLLVNQYGYNECITNDQIEKVVDKYKSFNTPNDNIYFNIIEGDDILKGYQIDNYEKRNSSALHGSCMNNKSDLLKLYTQNKNKVKLLTLNRNDKIIGRSLIWDLDKPKYIFMDRIYAVDNYLYKIFEDFAISNNWIYRENYARNVFKVNCYFKSKNSHIEKLSNKIRLTVKLNTDNIKLYPYMDSFVYRSHLTNKFYINSKNMINYTYYQSTNGGKTTIKNIPMLSLFS